MQISIGPVASDHSAAYLALVGTLGGVIIGATLTWVKELIAYRHSRDGKSCYLAIRVVCILDDIIEKCADVARDDGLYMGERNSHGHLESQVIPPQNLTYPDDLDWKSINSDLMYSILAIPNQLEAANNAVRSASENASPPDFEEAFEEQHYQFSKLGLEIYSVTKALRKKNGIPEPSKDRKYALAYLLTLKEKIMHERSEREKQFALFYPDIKI